MFQSLLKILLLLLCMGNVQAHIVEQLYLTLEKSESSLQLNVTFDAAYSLPNLRNDPTTPQPPRAWLVKQTKEQHEHLRRGAQEYLREAIRLTYQGEELAYDTSFPDYAVDPPDFPILLNDGAYFTVRLSAQIPTESTGDVAITIPSGEYPAFIVAEKQASSTKHIVIFPGQTVTLYTITSTGAVTSSTHSLMHMLWLGFRHVIPDGLDHLLFILGLFLMVRKWQPLVSQSLIFTLAHSISLGLAVAGVLRVQQWPIAWLIEPLIALSIVAIAIENLFYQETGVRRLMMVFIFGLIHGLGFAGSLGAMLQKDENWLTTLATANIGVELAQVCILAVAWCLTIKWWDSKHYPYFRTWASITIAAVGLYWTIERLVL